MRRAGLMSIRWLSDSFEHCIYACTREKKKRRRYVNFFHRHVTRAVFSRIKMLIDRWEFASLLYWYTKAIAYPNFQAWKLSRQRKIIFLLFATYTLYSIKFVVALVLFGGANCFTMWEINWRKISWTRFKTRNNRGPMRFLIYSFFLVKI